MNVDLQRLTTDQRFAKHHEHENLQGAIQRVRDNLSYSWDHLDQ